MSFKLIYTDSENNTHERVVKPLGNYSIITTLENHQYREELSGTMKFTDKDFDWIINAGECAEIYIECEFKRLWKGVFSHTDCTEINLSKRWLDVVPRADDEYSKIEPWMRLDFNIIPPYKGINSKVPIDTYIQYELERKIARITTPYDGVNSQNWVGYSLNDFIGGSGNYRNDDDRVNSLVYELTKNIPEIGVDVPAPGSGTVVFEEEKYFPGWDLLWGYSPQTNSYSPPNRNTPSGWPQVRGTSQRDNQMLYLSYAGYMRYVSGDSLQDYIFKHRNIENSFFMLTEILNHYDDSGNWEYCDLIYEREIFRGGRPPSGNIPTPSLISEGGWSFRDEEEIWVRKPMSIQEYKYEYQWQQSLSVYLEESLKSGNGFWYSNLLPTSADNKIRAQYLSRNRYYSDFISNPTDWYKDLYGEVYLDDHFHRIIPTIKKFIQFTRDSGSPTNVTVDDIESRFFTLEANPFASTIGLFGENVFRNMLWGQNSDIKRPLVTERATREKMTFVEFLDIICKLGNCAWAVIDGKLVIEHISYFENGLRYNPNIVIEGMEVPEPINPFSITNVAKNKGFMALTNIYAYDIPNMQKFEIFRTTGGREPINDAVKIEYFGGCINNMPRENIKEISIETTTDYNFVRTEGRNEGISFIKVQEGGFGELSFFPALDIFGRYVYNQDITLESLVELYYRWGRHKSEAKLNGQEWTGLRPFNNIIQRVAFPYVQEAENPYTHVLTGIGEGMVRRSEYTTKKGWMEYELGLNSIEIGIPPEVIMDWHIYKQEVFADRVWTFQHDMETMFMMRPIVFDAAGNEITYNTFEITNNRVVTLTFTQPVIGEVHLISLRTEPSMRFTYQGSGTQWEVQHNFNRPAEELGLSCVLDNFGNEIRPESIIFEDNNKIILNFTNHATGTITVANISGYVENIDTQNISNQDSATFTPSFNTVSAKPIVLEAGNEIFYNSHNLTQSLRTLGFTENVIAKIIVQEKNKS